ncbi:hypothetical protein DICPUDRAFT_77234 [Dictyostelium purpureum]|uniref:Uncharacterized protein n=1 Tax=Dictyostelium purpureum TaxID=5786 RepID=F0ZG06_DICPU|nr:uncharacterized protein DICPUDRAFT_77234 [Dictyostelium purpureum]EGC37132.1 hypothetical protein DICPUDRAFT_77234 [Dictyostelium purpureum]|eukprot:XP_003286335.1 hypothetical protein DICPUDRAFT_77234 [Dictyostelium purpureum]
MHILPGYIHIYILETLFNYKYNQSQLIDSFNYDDNNFSSTQNNETILISLVSKSWFSYCSKIITNLLKQSNHLRLYQFIKDNRYNINNYSNNENNSYNNGYNKDNINNLQSWKLIKKVTYIRISYDELKYLKGNKDSFNNIRIKVDNLDLDNKQITEMKSLNQEIKGIKEIKELEQIKYPHNFEFQINIGDHYNSFNESFSNNQNNNLSLNLYGISVPLLELMKLKPRRVQYQPNEYAIDTYIHRSYTCFFKSECLEELHISRSDHVNPFDISTINNESTRLKSVSISILFHSIIKGLNDYNKIIKSDINHYDNSKSNIAMRYLKNECNERYRGIKLINSVKEDWDQMVATLSINSTIKELHLNNFKCIRACHFQDVSVVTLGLGQIFSSPFTSIETLKLENFDFIDPILLSGLSQSKTIKNLSIILDSSHKKSFQKVSLIFEKYLILDISLRNLEIISNLSLCDFISIFQEYQNNLALYSISIFLDNYIKNEILIFKNNILSSQLNIIEFIFYNNNNNYFSFINNNNNNIFGNKQTTPSHQFLNSSLDI